MNSLLFIPYFPIVFLNYPPLLCGGQNCVVHGRVIYRKNPYAKKKLKIYMLKGFVLKKLNMNNNEICV